MNTHKNASLLVFVSVALLACSPQSTPPANVSTTTAATTLAPLHPVPMEILGITIGESLKLPRCIKREDFNVKTTCWRKTFDDQQRSKTMPEDVSLHVNFAGRDVPIGIYESADVVVTGGKVSYVSLTTVNYNQESIYKMLETKWGKPYKANVANLQNGFGAQFQSIEAQWVFPKLRILFLGRSTSDAGLISFESLPQPKSSGPVQPTSL